MDLLPPGTVLDGRYLVEGVLHSGHTGTIYRGYLATLPVKALALKALHLPGDTEAERATALQHFHQEAGVFASIDHPGVVHILDFFLSAGHAWLVTDFLDGISLRQWLLDLDGWLSIELGLRLSRQLCDVLQFCHAHVPPILLRDLHPGNVMILEHGVARLVDFGLARVLEPGAHTASFLRGLGTHGFTPLEQYLPGSHGDQTSDIYALGATMYAIFTSHAPPSAVELATRQATLVPPNELRPELPAALSDLIGRTLQMEKVHRPQTVDEVRQHLLHIFAPPAVAPSELRVKTPRPPHHPLPTAPSPMPAPLPPRPRPRTVPEKLLSGRPEVKAMLEPTERSHTPVTVRDIGLDALLFDTPLTLPVPAIMRMKLAVPLLMSGQSLVVDVRVRVTGRDPYHASFLDLPDKLRPILAGLPDQERRQAHRFRCGFRILSRALPGFMGTALDLSATGFGFWAADPLPEGDTCEFRLDLDAGIQALTEAVVPACIIHSRLRPRDGGYRIGAAFTALEGGFRQALYRYLESL